MGLADRMKPHIKDALAEIPVAHRAEASDAMADVLEFEEWRTEQEPVVEDTPANRAEYFAAHYAGALRNQVRNIVKKARSEAATADVDTDLDS